ncbi:MAG: hypothetical protein N2511_08330 [Thermodesulfovibrionales bacterium]|nr:hypothetical protein [Thermodesulfovibrionales bacterium]
MNAEQINYFLTILGIFYPFIDDLKRWVEKKEHEHQIKQEIKKLHDDFSAFKDKLRIEGRRFKTKIAQKEMLGLLQRIRPLKIHLIEYSKAYLSPAEKAEIKELLLVQDSLCEAIFCKEGPFKLKELREDYRVERALRVAYGEEADQYSLLLAKINWKKYPKKYFDNLKMIAKEIYEAGRPYDF